MAEKPILFGSEMVRAILDGRKSQTRRVIKGANPNWIFDSLSDCACMTGTDKHGNEYAKDIDGLWACFESSEYYMDFPMFKSKYQVGDILWVRETWRYCKDLNEVCYKASQPYTSDNCRKFASVCEHRPKWRPSLFMPKEAARIFLRVTDLRVERLQDISPEDCIAEGIQTETPMFMVGFNSAKEIERHEKKQVISDYAKLWDSLNAKRGYGWDTNPFCWVITFERIDRADETEG